MINIETILKDRSELGSAILWESITPSHVEMMETK
jgi:hypothetical protein